MFHLGSSDSSVGEDQHDIGRAVGGADRNGLRKEQGRDRGNQREAEKATGAGAGDGRCDGLRVAWRLQRQRKRARAKRPGYLHAARERQFQALRRLAVP